MTTTLGQGNPKGGPQPLTEEELKSVVDEGELARPMIELIAGFKRLHVTKHKFWRWPESRRRWYWERSRERFERRHDAFVDEDKVLRGEFGRYETVRFIRG